MEIKLKQCPFCGGTAEIKEGNSYYIKCVRVQCTHCGVTMPKVPIDHKFYTKGKWAKLTIGQAMEKTANEWNTRVR